jgi:hypothetical protein
LAYGWGRGLVGRGGGVRFVRGEGVGAPKGEKVVEFVEGFDEVGVEEAACGRAGASRRGAGGERGEESAEG